MKDNLFRGILRTNEPMSKYTSWRVGGLAKCFYKPADVDDLSVFLSKLPEEEQVIFLGAGTNMLIKEQGFNGTIISINGCMNNFTILPEDNSSSIIVRAEAGMPISKLVHETVHKSFCGLESLAGIPGTVGGALAMNAGAFDTEIWKHVTKVETINSKGQRYFRYPSDYQISYRHVKGPKNEWFVAGYFNLQKGDKELAMKKIFDNLNKRHLSQPLDLPNAGSVFRNPEGDYAARLIENCGLKGFRIGGACVSDKHANFIVNDKGATSFDIEQLIEHIVLSVEEKFGIRLIPEVCIV